MTIKQTGGIFGRNPTFNDVDVDGDLSVSGDSSVSGDTTTTRLSVGTSNAPPSPYSIYLRSRSDSGNLLNTLCEDLDGGVISGQVLSRTDYKTAEGTGQIVASQRVEYTNAIGGAKFVFATSSNGSVAATDRVTITDSGNLAFQSGKGIDFSATSGTGTSELFDDYEEGTWTPVFSDASSGGNTASGSALGYYIKVGGLVYVTGQFENVNTTGMTSGNILYVQGIPYTPSSLPNDVFFMGSVKCDGVTNNGFVNVESADNFAWLRFSETNNTTAGFLTVGDFASGTADIYFSLCYRAI